MKTKGQKELSEKELQEKLLAKKIQNEKDFYNHILQGAKKFNCTIIPTLEIMVGEMPAEISILDLLKDHKINIRTKSN